MIGSLHSKQKSLGSMRAGGSEGGLIRRLSGRHSRVTAKNMTMDNVDSLSIPESEPARTSRKDWKLK